jgi:hypothetical protein
VSRITEILVTIFLHAIYSKLKYVKRANKVNTMLFDSGLGIPLTKGQKTCDLQARYVA